MYTTSQDAFQEFTQENQPAAGGAQDGASNYDAILGIPVKVQVILGGASMTVAELLKIGRGAVIPLNRRVGDSFEITVNGKVFARGEIVKVEDDNGAGAFGISVTEVVNQTAGAAA